MPRTFTNEPLGDSFRYTVKTEHGHYVMGKSWIDTTCPNDMMDYDFTDTIEGLKKSHNDIRLMNAGLQNNV